jgi:hypothetical protein
MRLQREVHSGSETDRRRSKLRITGNVVWGLHRGRPSKHNEEPSYYVYYLTHMHIIRIYPRGAKLYKNCAGYLWLHLRFHPRVHIVCHLSFQPWAHCWVAPSLVPSSVQYHTRVRDCWQRWLRVQCWCLKLEGCTLFRQSHQELLKAEDLDTLLVRYCPPSVQQSRL